MTSLIATSAEFNITDFEMGEITLMSFEPYNEYV